MPLNHLQYEAAKPQLKPYKINDGNGLYLQIMPNGSKYWQHRFRYQNKQRCLSLGTFPLVSLAEARTKLKEAKLSLVQNIDPKLQRQQQKQLANYEAGLTFKAIAIEWYELNKESWTERHANYVLRRLELHTFKEIGDYPISQLTPALVMVCLQKIEKTGPEMARRVMSMCSRIFQYAIATGRGERDLTVGLKYGLKKHKPGRYAAVTLDELPELVRKIHTNDARLYRQTHLCLKLMLLTAVRTSELIEAKWAEFDFDKSLWVIPAERMKTRKLHKVPLSKQAHAILAQLKEINGKREFVFPSIPRPRKPMSNATILKALANIGYKYKMTGHGFRSVLMGVCKQQLGYRHEPVDRQLAHAPRNSVDRAYDRADYLPERIVMMQEYADYIDSIINNQPFERITNATNRNTNQPFKNTPTTFNGEGYRATIGYQTANFTQSMQSGVVSSTTQGHGQPYSQMVERRDH